MQGRPRDFEPDEYDAEEGTDGYDFGPDDFPGGAEHHGFVPDTGGRDFESEQGIDDVMTPAGGESSGGNPPPPPYSEANSADPADVNVIVDGIKVPYDVKDPVYWFRRLEIRMQTVGIGSQF